MIISYDYESVKREEVKSYSMQKKLAERLVEVYELLQTDAVYCADLDFWERKVDLVRYCGTNLSFERMRNIETGEQRLKLVGANFCRQLLCPMCQWRRARKLYYEMLVVWRAIFDQYRELEFKHKHRIKPKLRGLLLTLTVPNVPGSELRQKIDDMTAAWHRMSRYPEWAQIKGYYRTLEVTYNAGNKTYHPHYHVLLLVDNDYFGAGYVQRDRWLEIWRKCMRDDSITQVDVRVLRGSKPDVMLKNLNEVCKYTCKPMDYLQGDLCRCAEVVEVLDKQLKGVRRASFGGWIKEMRAIMQIDDDISRDYDTDECVYEKIGDVWFYWANGVYVMV